MAQNWIKMRTDLREDPAVYRLSAEMGIDRFAVVGKLHAFWSWWDDNSRNGRCNGAVTAMCDDITQTPGFGAALIAVKWLGEDGDGLFMPNYDRHNGRAAKERALTNKRVELHRARNAPSNGSVTPTKRKGNASTVTRVDKSSSNKHLPVANSTAPSQSPQTPVETPQPQTPPAPRASPPTGESPSEFFKRHTKRTDPFADPDRAEGAGT